MARTWINDLVKRAQAVGWDVKLTGKNHYVVTADNGEVTTLPSTTGSYRAQKNAEAWMSRQGLEEAEKAARADRLKRRATAIARDRERVPAAATAVEPSKGDPVKRQVTTEPGSLGYVDGVAIVERAPAMFTTPVMRGKMRAMDKGEELLLADERIVYRCLEPAATVMHPDVEGVCHRTFDSVDGLRGHATFHKRTTMPKPPDRSPRKNEPDAPDVPDAPDGAAQPEPEPELEPAPVPTLDERVRDVAARVQRLRRVLAVQLSNLDDLNATVVELVAAVETSALDPEIARKAALYDQVVRAIADDRVTSP